MKKIALAIVGAGLLFFGAVDYIDYAAGAYLSFDFSPLVAGLMALTVLGVLFLRDWLHDRSLRRSNFPFMALVAAPSSLEGAFDPTKPWQMLQWNYDAVSGLGVWICILIFMAVYGLTWLIVQKLWRGKSEQPKKL